MCLSIIVVTVVYVHLEGYVGIRWKNVVENPKFRNFRAVGKVKKVKGKVKTMSCWGWDGFWGGKRLQDTWGRSPVSRTNVQRLLTRSYTGSWGLYYTPVGHHVNPGMIHHPQECPDTRSLVIHLRLQICHCKSCGTSCLSKTKSLYYILNQRSVTAPGAEHLSCLVTNVELKMDYGFMGEHIDSYWNFWLQYIDLTVHPDTQL